MSSRAPRFFRWIWRINAVLILVAAAAAVCGVVAFVVSEVQSSVRRHDAVAAAPRVVANSESAQLHLGGFSIIPGTSVYKALLTSGRGGIDIGSSGYAADTRNILFVDLATGAGKWLLPSDDQTITFDENVDENHRDADRTTLANVFLVKPYSSHSEAAPGRLLVTDATAAHVTEIAPDVQSVNGVTLTPAGEIAVFFQRGRNYEVALIDKSSLRKISERTITVPELK
jgi:hypothetical protein